MNYTKPEVTVLGKAAVVIETQLPPKGPPNVPDGARILALNTAYDLDE